MKIKNMLLVFMTALGLVGYTSERNIDVTAKEWNNGIVEEGQKATKVDEGYGTSQFGDAFTIMSLASGMSLDALQQLQHSEDLNMIYSGMNVKIINNQTIVAVDPNKEEEQDDSEKDEESYDQEEMIEEVVEESQPVQQAGYELTVEASAYSYQEAGLSSYTADGTNLVNEPNIIAVDPSVIPLGTLVEIPGYGIYRAADTGGAIKGNRIDIHMTSINAMNQFGRRTITIRVLN